MRMLAHVFSEMVRAARITWSSEASPGASCPSSQIMTLARPFWRAIPFCGWVSLDGFQPPVFCGSLKDLAKGKLRAKRAASRRRVEVGKSRACGSRGFAALSGRQEPVMRIRATDSRGKCAM